MSEELEKLEQKMKKAERKMIAARNKEKYLEHESSRLTRSDRTHRLCTRAGMLEAYLRESSLLTDDDVMELLSFIFHQENVQKKLEMLIENRRNLTESGVMEHP